MLLTISFIGSINGQEKPATINSGTKPVTCTRKITPQRWRESTRMKMGDFCYEENIYGRADREHSAWF